MIMPLYFKQFDNESVLLTNDGGEFHFLTKEEFEKFIHDELSEDSGTFHDLLGKQFLSNSKNTDLQVSLLATKYRTRKRFLNNFTSLHMMVITYRCNHRCRYCQVASEASDAFKFDMTPETARKVVETIFTSPSPEIKIEFQGGEPTLNWETVVETVKYAEHLNARYKKELAFVLCTNLTSVNEDKLEFIAEHNVFISTSLDGNKDLHDKNRIMRAGGSSYDKFQQNLQLTKNYIDPKTLGPLMTTTKSNINYLRKVVDEYIRCGFNHIFIRPLNPYGFASSDISEIKYPIEEFVEAYKDCLEYILYLNKQGYPFVEIYTSLLLKRILTPFSTGFVDLQSPSGAGISGAIYDYNGDVYPADEARMLAKMGDKRFYMGNVKKNSYLEVFQGNLIKEIVSNSCLEIMPKCNSCVYAPFCGADPVRNYMESGDLKGYRPTSDFCKKNKAIFNFLFSKLKQQNSEEMDVFWSWITSRSVEELRV